MRTANRHLRPKELLETIEGGHLRDRHLAECDDCREEVQGYAGVLRALKASWIHPPLILPKRDKVVALAVARQAEKQSLLTLTLGWILLLLIASVMTACFGSVMSEISRRVALPDTVYGMSALLVGIMVVLGILVSPVLILFETPNRYERRLAR